MDIIKASIERPTAVVAAIFMTIVLGFIALDRIPIQLAPDVNKPVITVSTNWYGASPYEIEREIVNRQEEVLKGIEGSKRLSAKAQEGRSEVTIEFDTNINMDRALLLVSNRLNQIEGYPEDAGEPSLDTAGLDDNAIAWFILTKTDGNETDIAAYGDIVEDVIQDKIERVPGVARTTVYGGSETELRVTIDPEKMANYGLTVPQVALALQRANASISAGDVEEGKRRYIVRAEGEFQTPDQVKNVVLISDENDNGRLGRVTIDDIAEVEFTHKEPTSNIRFLGDSSLAINAVRQSGGNVIEIMKGVRNAVKELNEDSLPNLGLKLEQVYDETIYIDSAIELVRQNIWIGGTLAIFILILFLRSWRATVIIGLSIPISVVAAFVAMAALGRSINVISLAGIAFAVGMVVDAAIVVLENIYRHRENGKEANEAAYFGAKQVWSAVMVSALTTVLVFVPILIMQLEAGQLFRDIAVAISVAVTMSLLVSVTVLPALAKWLLTGVKATKKNIFIIDNIARGFVKFTIAYVKLITKSRIASLLVAGTVALGALSISYSMLPKLEYLPEGNRNLIFGIMLPPPGYNLETLTEIAERVETRVKTLWASETGPEAEEGQPPKIRNYFFVAGAGGRTLFGASAIQDTRVRELIPVLTRSLFGEPGTFGFFTQPSLFQRGFGGGRSIDLDITGPDLEKVVIVAQQAAGLVGKSFPRNEGNQMRPIPGLVLGAPEIQVQPNRVKLADNNISAQSLALSVDAFNSGLRIAEITVDSKRMDLTLRGKENAIKETQGIENIPVVTPSGKILPISSLADVVMTSGPTEIRHIERDRTITLQIKPIDKIPLEAAIDTIREKIILPLEQQGLPTGINLNLSGTADELTSTWNAMVMNLLVAICMVYLLMAILFESFIYPLVIMLSVPPAAAGGVMGLWVLNLNILQPLDMLTMLGFVILIGIVVNNAILLVHQTLQHMKEENLNASEAILEATRNRIRPIFMSTLTSVFGMIPLVVFPGAGSELYRGLGSVVIGGLCLSAILTLAIVPPMLRIFIRENLVKSQSINHAIAE
ncbi:MAG: efflux RND transporter permease subunit [Alphaproteobacteria bacterium]